MGELLGRSTELVDGTARLPGEGIAIHARSRATRTTILDAAKESLLDGGFAALSTRGIAERAGVPLSQIHYHFGSKQQLVLALLEHENEQRLARQTAMYEEDVPLSKQWEQACDHLEDDLDSGYVRVLNEMAAAGWSDPQVAGAVRGYVLGWHRLLTRVAEEFGRTHGGFGPFSGEEAAAFVGMAFVGAESLILLGVDEDDYPIRAALRRIGELIRLAEEPRPETGPATPEPVRHDQTIDGGC